MSCTIHRIGEAIAEYRAELSQTMLADLMSSFGTFQHANDELHRLSGICCFFQDQQTLQEFQRALASPASEPTAATDREWGDFQTPPNLAMRVCGYLSSLGVAPRVIIEPTFGLGNFILAALHTFPTVERVYGIEIQATCVWRFKLALLATALHRKRTLPEIELHQDNIFTHNFQESIVNAQDILIIGNPPWVTNAELGALEAHNLPKKQNFKAIDGIAAITGKSNFDLGEFVLLRLLENFSQRRGALAMLCKDSVVKNIVESLRTPQSCFNISEIRSLKIDANREFGAAVEASLLVMNLGATQRAETCQVATLEHPKLVTRTFGWVRDKFVSDIAGYESNAELDGHSALIWRQGVKHDCAKIMELEWNKGYLTNGYNQDVDIEEEHTYWLLKGSDLRSFEAARPRKKIIVTQSRPGEETRTLKVKAPALWKYLTKNQDYFEKRKSSIYRGKPRFSIFGIGDYSFRLYKVAISGLYKQPIFSLVLPVDNRPVMLDDTCYLLGFDTYLEAILCNSLLNSPPVIRFLRSVVFEDAKRPYTKQVLMRIDIAQAASKLSFESLQNVWADNGYQPTESITELDWEKYKQRFSSEYIQQANPQLGLAI